MNDFHKQDEASIREFVVGEIEAIGVDADSVSLDATLEELGLDSLDVVELSQGVTKQLGITVNPKDFVGAVTVSDVLTIVHARAETA